jgi:hypothetical protein
MAPNAPYYYQQHHGLPQTWRGRFYRVARSTECLPLAMSSAHIKKLTLPLLRQMGRPRKASPGWGPSQPRQHFRDVVTRPSPTENHTSNPDLLAEFCIPNCLPSSDTSDHRFQGSNHCRCHERNPERSELVPAHGSMGRPFAEEVGVECVRNIIDLVLGTR